MTKETVRNIVYLYSGPGTSTVCLDQTQKLFSQCLQHHYRIERIQPEDVINGSWQTQAACFVMPGGRDSPYHESLNPAGITKIQEYVQIGGSYLGICAGAYFAAKQIEFALGSSIEVNQERTLKFYEGTASGPVFADFEYHTQKGAHAAQIAFAETSAMIYFNGGCTFLEAGKVCNLQIIGHYQLNDGKKLSAIVHIKQGRGYVILSGVHFEFDPETMDANDSHLSTVIPEIQRTNFERLNLAKQLLNLLNLEVRHDFN